MAVAIIVEKSTATVPSRTGLLQPCLDGDIGEGTVAVVMEERILAVVGDEQVVESIVVVVADTTALPPAAACEPGLRGDIGEGSITIVFEEVAGGFTIFGKALQTPSVHEKNVWPSVVIVVIKGSATPGGFEQVF